MKEKINNKTGITLIALIITIIVMLILVTVSINVLIQSNILGSAKNAGESYKEEIDKEAVLGDEITIDNTTYGGLEDYTKGITIGEADAAKIARTIDKTGYYGKTVNYTAPVENGGTPITWKVFFADNKNIYLIASDVVKISESSKLNDLNKVSGNEYAGYFTKIINASPNLYADGAAHTFSSNSEYNEQVKNWLQYFKVDNIVTTNQAIKATVYMLDTNIWSDYTNTEYAAWSINSYNNNYSCLHGLTNSGSWIISYSCTDKISFRPVICLSSEVKLTTDSTLKGTCDFGLIK